MVTDKQMDTHTEYVPYPLHMRSGLLYCSPISLAQVHVQMQLKMYELRQHRDTTSLAA